MIFNEIYSAYYNVVASVLAEAVTHPVTEAGLRSMIMKHAFGESIVSIPEALKKERWQVLKADGTTPLKNIPELPLTLTQKRWLKAVAKDPRIRLFGDVGLDFPEVEPLFLPSDVIVFDKYLDGDNYEDEEYIANFRLILDAITKKYPLKIEIRSRKGRTVRRAVMPEYLEYSEKDDKFRLFGQGETTVNLGRIIKCSPYDKPYDDPYNKPVPEIHGDRAQSHKRSVTFDLTDERNALERVLLHFAHFEKTAERIEENQYKVTVKYDRDDETELVIRILSFGPMVRVTSPPEFIELIKQRLIEQKSCER